MRKYTEDEKFMKEAIKQAKKAEAIGDVPIGCVIVHDGKIIARGYNKRNKDKTVLAHAELLAMKKACKKLGDWRLEDCTMYITLEPCQMCAGAIVQARVTRVVIGSMNAKAGCGGSILNLLEMQCQKILNTEYSEKLDELYLLGGTSGGARPKIMTEIDREAWIIKFPAHVDGQDAGGMEYEYALCAKACGIDMTEVRLFPSKKCKGYFGIKRFDRERIVDGIGTKVKAGNKKKRIHMLTAAALLELDFEQPSLDYHSLMKLTKILTRDNEADVREMFRRMCFNVFAHNRDDHSKNFTYLYDEMKKGWRLSPAYDLTFSNTYYGEHTTMVDGNGRNPGKKELLVVGMQAGLEKSWCEEVIEKIKNTVEERLERYL